MPQVIGLTAAAQQVKSAVPREAGEWNEEKFLEALRSNRNVDEANVVERILRRAEEEGWAIWWGRGALQGSLFLGFRRDNFAKGDYWLVSFWTPGRVEVQFKTLRSRPPFDKEDLRRELMQRFNQLPGVQLDAQNIGGLPSFQIAALTDDAAFAQLFEVLKWLQEQMTS